MSKISRRLEASLTQARIVTIVRDAFEIGMTYGVVLALTDDWLVIHSLEGVYFDDIVMLRLRDVSRVWFRDDDAYHHRAIAGLNQKPGEFECANDATAPNLLSAVSARADIFAIHLEVLRGEPLLIGRLLELRKKSFRFHYVGRDGVWSKDIDRVRYRDLTRIEIDGRYLDALNRFADPYPDSTPVE